MKEGQMKERFIIAEQDSCIGEAHSSIEAARRFVTQISLMSADVHKSTGTPANCIVASPAVVKILEPILERGVSSVAGQDEITMIGTLLYKFSVFQDDCMGDTQIIVGLKEENQPLKREMLGNVIRRN